MKFSIIIGAVFLVVLVFAFLYKFFFRTSREIRLNELRRLIDENARELGSGESSLCAWTFTEKLPSDFDCQEVVRKIKKEIKKGSFVSGMTYLLKSECEKVIRFRKKRKRLINKIHAKANKINREHDKINKKYILALAESKKPYHKHDYDRIEKDILREKDSQSRQTWSPIGGRQHNIWRETQEAAASLMATYEKIQKNLIVQAQVEAHKINCRYDRLLAIIKKGRGTIEILNRFRKTYLIGDNKYNNKGGEHE
jgi:hypothetical protein